MRISDWSSDVCSSDLQGEGILANHLMDDVHLVRYEPGRVALRVTDAAPANLARRFGAILEKACGGRWVINISQQQGDATLRQQARTAEAAKRAAVMQHDPKSTRLNYSH